MFNEVKRGVYPRSVYLLQTSPMREDYQRLLDAAFLLKAWIGPKEISDGLTANGYEVSPQTMTNWKSRGLSKEAKLRASRVIGCRAEWLDTGSGEMSPSGIVSLANLVTLDAETHSSTYGLPRQHGGKQQGTQTTDADQNSISGEKPTFGPSSQPNSPADDRHHTSYRLRPVPLINFERLSMSIEAAVSEADTTVPSAVSVGERAFAFKMPDSSQAPRIAPGALLVIDPDASPVMGASIVLASYQGGRPVCRHIIVDGPRTYLRTLNEPPVLDEISDDWRILGVVRFIGEEFPCE